MGRKLDLSKLTDEEAKHVWEVVQRDFDLRKKEEERLEELKCKIDQESSKREFLTNQSHLNETHCVHCLQPFKFLLNSKRQIVKIGSLEWYYEHMRSRFKRFGSAKVLQSLYGRLQPGQELNSAFLGLHDRVYSLPDINRECQLLTSCEAGDDSDEEDNVLRGAEAERYSRHNPTLYLALFNRTASGPNSLLKEEETKERNILPPPFLKMCKTKRLLSVHPFDFELDSDYSAQSRRQSVQLSPAASSPDAFQESRITDADLVFHHVLQEPGVSTPEQHFSTEVRLTLNARRRSLERNPKPGIPWIEPPRARYSADMDTSDEDMKGAQLPTYPPHQKRRNRASSQENISHSSNQIHELNTRMSAIERVLNRLEKKILTRSDESPAPESHTDPDAEEEELKRKLEELASNISDKEVSSDEEERGEEKRAEKPEMSSSTDGMARDVRKALSEITAKVLRAINATEEAVWESLHGESQVCALPAGQLPGLADGREVAEVYQELEENVYLTAGKTYQLEKTLKELEEGAQHSGTTDSELSELEDKVASAAAQVQQAESEISDIESRIAALSAAGLTVKSVEKAKKSSAQAACLHSPGPASSSPGESLDDIKAMPGLQRFRRKFNSPLEITSFDDSFERNSVYRGSLTQRNPNGKNRRVERLFAHFLLLLLSPSLLETLGRKEARGHGQEALLRVDGKRSKAWGCRHLFGTGSARGTREVQSRSDFLGGSWMCQCDIQHRDGAGTQPSLGKSCHCLSLLSAAEQGQELTVTKQDESSAGPLPESSSLPQAMQTPTEALPPCLKQLWPPGGGSEVRPEESSARKNLSTPREAVSASSKQSVSAPLLHRGVTPAKMHLVDEHVPCPWSLWKRFFAQSLSCTPPTFLPPSFPPSLMGEVGRNSQLEQGLLGWKKGPPPRSSKGFAPTLLASGFSPHPISCLSGSSPDSSPSMPDPVEESSQGTSAVQTKELLSSHP
ncbi:hypothetical protein IHE44_0014220, partial [Lamprotornis superbus]